MKKDLIELTKKLPDFDTMAWVSKAITKDSTRLVLHYIHVELSPSAPSRLVAVATDGRRLHAGHLEAVYAPGNYRIVYKNCCRMLLVRDDDDTSGTYPGWFQVVPKCKSGDMVFTETTWSKPDTGLKKFLAATKTHALKGALFNMDYLLDAIDYLNGFYLNQADKNEPLLLQDAQNEWTRQAVLMPLRST